MKSLQRGFTLIELLVVVTIIAMVSSLVVTSIGNDPNRIMENTAQRFVSQIELMSEEAALRGIDFGLFIDEEKKTYQFLVFADNQWTTNTIPQYAKVIEVSDFLNVTIELTNELNVNMLEGYNPLLDAELNNSVEFDEEQLFPQVAILSSGEFTPFQITLATVDESEELTINVDMQGKHTLNRENNLS